jgi:hypothetical protein
VFGWQTIGSDEQISLKRLFERRLWAKTSAAHYKKCPLQMHAKFSYGAVLLSLSAWAQGSPFGEQPAKWDLSIRIAGARRRDY